MTRFWVAALLAMSLAGSNARACKCVPASVEWAAAHAHLAFAGTITKVTKTSACEPKHPDWCIDSFSYEVAVDSVWKGNVPATTTVRSGSGTGDCSRGSLGDVENKRWLFFTLDGKTSDFDVSLCGGTQPATTAAVTDLTKTLGAPTKPT